MRKLRLKRKSATALGACFGQTGGDRKAQAAGLDCLPPGILGLTDGVLRPPAATLAKAADWPFQKSGIRVVYPLEKGNGGEVEKWRSGEVEEGRSGGGEE